MMTLPKEPPRSPDAAPAHAGGLLALGFGANLLDTLGVGSFATTSVALRLGKLVDDTHIPGTLNVGHALPTMLEAALFLALVPVDLLTMLSMIAAGGLGAWFGTGLVIGLPRRKIQRAMALALLVTATFIVLRQLQVFPSGGDAIGLSGASLLVGIAASLVIGSLTSLGIGNYAPTMAVTYLLGMNPRAVFPIMAASAALILPTAAIRFYKSGRFDRRTALSLTVGGIPGVLIAFFVIKELNVDLLRWLVVAVLCYTSALLYRASIATSE